MTLTDIENKTFTYPTPSELDTQDRYNVGFSVDVYLDPERLELVAFSGAGNKGTPAPAWNNRWAFVASFGHSCVGQSILDALMAHEGLARDVAAEYRGSEWDGSKDVGQWSEDAGEAKELLREAVQDEEVLRHDDDGIEETA